MKKLIYIIFLFLGISWTIAGCTKGGEDSEEGIAAQDTVAEDFDAAIELLDSLMSKSYSNKWTGASQWNSNEGTPLNTYAPEGDWEEILWDKNHSHFKAGKTAGIAPINSDTFDIAMRKPLERVVATEYYFLDKLTHSFPYLVPEGHRLLDEIGKRFHDTLQARGGGPYRLKVTSLLRTNNTVSRLRQVNDASVDSSSHLFGTTFDISFNNFGYDGGEPRRKQADLKKLLAETIFNLQKEGKCYTIYEDEPGCFHTTVVIEPPKNWRK